MQGGIRDFTGTEKGLDVEGHGLAGEKPSELHEFGHGAPVGEEVQKTVQSDGTHADPEAALLVPDLVAKKCILAQLVAFQLLGEVTAVSLVQVVPVADALVDLDGDGEIVARNTAQGPGGLRALRD